MSGKKKLFGNAFGQRRSKYCAKATYLDGKRFASKKEAARYGQLKAMADAGYIKNLNTQVPFEIKINDKKICKYLADFCYEEVATGESVVEDVKGFRTDIYKLKKKLVEAIYGISIKEV